MSSLPNARSLRWMYVDILKRNAYDFTVSRCKYEGELEIAIYYYIDIAAGSGSRSVFLYEQEYCPK